MIECCIVNKSPDNFFIQLSNIESLPESRILVLIYLVFSFL